jgi:threonine/homoserine/homoserine lactone efflux protein
LLSLVVSETLRGNRLNGILIALAPLITDIPIVLLSILILKSASGSNLVLGVMSMLGAIFLAYIGMKNLTFKTSSGKGKNNYSTSIKYGVITNFLSPHPYLFWITVGAPTFIKAAKVEDAYAYIFIAAFYFLLIGSKIAVAIITGFFDNFLRGYAYKIIMKVLGLIIILYAFVTFYDGISLIFR